jgi:hypothetical protein
MTTDATETPEQHVQVEMTEAAELSPHLSRSRSRARLWLAAVGFLLAAAVVLAGIHTPDMHAHRLQAAAAARHLRVLQPAAAVAVKMPNSYISNKDTKKLSSAEKKAQRGRKPNGR